MDLGYDTKQPELVTGFLGEEIEPRLEVAYQRFLHSPAVFSRQDRAWFLLVVKHWVAIRDAEVFRAQGINPEDFLEIPPLDVRLKQINWGAEEVS